MYSPGSYIATCYVRENKEVSSSNIRSHDVAT